MEMWTEVRRRVLTGELSKCAACREYGLNSRTLAKILSHVEPPGCRRLLFGSPGCGSSGPNRRAVDAPEIPINLAIGIEADAQGFETSVVHARLPPPGEVVVHSLPRAEPFGQVPPRRASTVNP